MVSDAMNQLQTHESQIPALFDYNCALVISDGTEARIGVLGATLVMRTCSEGLN